MPRVADKSPWNRFSLVLARVVGGVLLCLATASAAEVYRWVDDQGRVHFGDRPPGDDAARVTVKPSASAGGSGTAAPAGAQTPRASDRLEAQRRLLKAYEQERQLKEEAASKALAERRERIVNCKVARARLKSYREATALYDSGSSGERRYLSHAERAAAERDAERAVDYWCG